jgi:L-alanine dehydrogenase (EC 1.4.1.1)
MVIGVPKEILNKENRVALTPTGVLELVRAGQTVLVETGAGVGSQFSDDMYRKSGAEIVESASEVWERSDLIVKVKAPVESEYKYFRKGLILFTFLHLAADPELAKALLEKQVTAIAYETVTVQHTLPILTPMSEIAGRMSVQIGAHYLEKTRSGKGILLGGIPGVKRGKVTIIGGGVVGENAAKIAIGLGAQVTVLDINPDRLRQLDKLFGREVQVLMSNTSNIAERVQESDLVIGSVLIPGRKAPKLVSKEMVKAMEPGSVIVDVAIDQGGNFETIDTPTSHDHPIIEKYGVLHYAVPNIPGAVPQTATVGLTNVTLPYVLCMSRNGVDKAILENEALKMGVNVMGEKVTHPAVAQDLGYAYVPVERVLNGFSLVSS